MAILGVTSCVQRRSSDDTARAGQRETDRATPSMSRESSREVAPGVEWWVTLSDTVVEPGRPVELRVHMYNTTSALAEVRVPSSRDQGVDVVVADGHGRVVWHRNQGFEPDLSGYPLHIPAGDAVTWTVVWTQRDTLGKAVSPGEFWVRAVLANRFPTDSGTGSVRLRVGR